MTVWHQSAFSWSIQCKHYKVCFCEIVTMVSYLHFPCIMSRHWDWSSPVKHENQIPSKLYNCSYRDPVMIEWFHEGTPVLGPHGDDHRIVLPDGSLFFLRALRGIDDGNYWCVASNLNFQQQQQPPSPRQLSLDASNRVARSRNATLRVACKKLPTIFHVYVPWDANRGAFSKVSKYIRAKAKVYMM